MRPSVAGGMVMAGLMAAASAMAGEPDFGPNVIVFEPGTPGIQERVSAVFAEQEASEFGGGRYALLFKPGTYDLDIRVGFYTQVAGLGASPDQVEIRGAVRSTAEWRNGNATCNFWRCAENLAIAPAAADGVNVWAVSQGVAMRRVHVKGSLNLSDKGWSSGGFLADCVIDGTVDSGSQQQWFSRNTRWGEWRGGNWNMVFVGVENPPAGKWPEKPYTVVERTPVVREKPYLYVDQAGGYAVRVPGLRKDSAGPTWSGGRETEGTSIGLGEFFVARADRDDASAINAALERGKHLLLTPGVYRLDRPLRVSRAGTVVLGLGYPTLVAAGGTEVLTAAEVGGVTIAGVLCEAGEVESPALVRVGEKSTARSSHESDPTMLFDVFCRAGGAAPGSAASMLTIESSDVVGDNLWLWRADHGAGAKWDVNRNRNGLIVNGDRVTMYGLFVEHQHEYQTLWNGEDGRVYFYQSEMPYDPPSEEAWSHDGVVGYASYKVAEHVKRHEAWGLGVYCVFRAAKIVAERAIEVPEVEGVKLHHMITIRLSGIEGSGIRRVINGRGEPVITTKRAVLE